MTFSTPVTTVSVACPEAQPSVLISGSACRSVNSRPGTVGFAGNSDVCVWQNRGNCAGVVVSTRVMGTHAGAETGSSDVIRHYAREISYCYLKFIIFLYELEKQVLNLHITRLTTRKSKNSLNLKKIVLIISDCLYRPKITS